MPDQELRYDQMVEEALRSVVGRALGFVAEHGLPGNHHFYITFRTDDPKAKVPARLRERYPSEMTIVLQYQFWDLKVAEDEFSITLSFGDVPETLTVPYRAVVAFADPSVRFGLQFDVDKDEKAADAEDAGPAREDAANGGAAPAGRQGAETGTSAGADSENVVPLDTFRKKST